MTACSSLMLTVIRKWCPKRFYTLMTINFVCYCYASIADECCLLPNQVQIQPLQHQSNRVSLASPQVTPQILPLQVSFIFMLKGYMGFEISQIHLKKYSQVYTEHFISLETAEQLQNRPTEFFEILQATMGMLLKSRYRNISCHQTVITP